MKRRIKLVIAEDHVDYRKLLAEAMTSFGFEVVDQASDGKELIDKLDHSKPDIVLLDLRMKGMDGDIAFDIIRKRFPDLKIIFQSLYSDKTLMEEFIRRGADGYIPKDTPFETLAFAIEEVKKGNKAFFFYEKSKGTFTRREAEIVFEICEGKTTKEIANDLGITVKTVEGHRKKILEKTKSRNVGQLIKYAVINGLDLKKRFFKK